MKRFLVVAALIAIFAIYFFQSIDQEKVKIGSSASPEKLTQRDYQDPPKKIILLIGDGMGCLLYTSPSPRDGLLSRMPSSA